MSLIGTSTYTATTRSDFFSSNLQLRAFLAAASLGCCRKVSSTPLFSSYRTYDVYQSKTTAAVVQLGVYALILTWPNRQNGAQHPPTWEVTRR